MKKIGLISDTHGWLDEAVFRHFEMCDEVWHAGDIGGNGVLEALRGFKLVRAVWGNIDDTFIRSTTAEHERFECEGVDVWMTHIGGRPGNYANPVREGLSENPPAIFICGHSHICLVAMDKRGKFLYMNPGAAGRHGFHKVRTILRFNLEAGKIENLEVVELGLRTG
jgi:putative phosphoesterase